MDMVWLSELNLTNNSWVSVLVFMFKSVNKNNSINHFCLLSGLGGAVFCFEVYFQVIFVWICVFPQHTHSASAAVPPTGPARWCNGGCGVPRGPAASPMCTDGTADQGTSQSFPGTLWFSTSPAGEPQCILGSQHFPGTAHSLRKYFHITISATCHSTKNNVL